MRIRLLKMVHFGLLSFAAVARADVSSQQTDEIVRRQKEYAASKLSDADPVVASSALYALATLSFAEHEDRLRKCLSLPLTDPSLDYALGGKKVSGTD